MTKINPKLKHGFSFDNSKLKHGFSFGGWLPKIIPEVTIPFLEESHSENNTTSQDNFFQFQAFLAGMGNASIANPNPSVGCVIVKDSQILASGCTHAWKGLHAERDAFQKVNKELLIGTTIYLTLEPCTHFGNQPPCIELFSNLGIKKVVISRTDPNPLVRGKSIGILEKMGIELKIGPLAKEVTAWNYPFFIQQNLKRPMIALKWAQNTNGSHIPISYGVKNFYNPCSEKYISWLRQKYDVLLISELSSLIEANPLKTPDISHFYQRAPLTIVIDPKANILFCSKDKQIMFKKNFFTKNLKILFLIDENMIREVLSSSLEWCEDLKTSTNIKFLPLKREFDLYSAQSVLESLKHLEFQEFLGRPLQSILIEDDAHLLNLFVTEELFDVAHIFTVCGALEKDKGTNFNFQKEFLDLNHSQAPSVKKWEIITHQNLGDDVLVEMTPNDRFEEAFY